MSDLAEKVADAVEVTLGDDGHCIVYKRLAVVAAIEAARQSSGQERGEAVAWRWSEDGGKSWFNWRTDWEFYEKAVGMGFPVEFAFDAPTDAQSRIAELEAQLAEAHVEAGKLLAEIERQAELLISIGNYAHDHSTGPAVPDALWEIRAMAYDGEAQ